jgi:trk system potassium uptake protein TrkA
VHSHYGSASICIVPYLSSPVNKNYFLFLFPSFSHLVTSSTGSYDGAMKVVILGAGRRGTLLARHLISEKRDVIVIDNDPRKVAEIQRKLDCMAVVGSGTDPEKLNSIDVQTSEYFIAVTDSDEINLVACGIVENLQPKVVTVAAIRNLTYTGKGGLPHTILGINHIVNPEAETAKSIYANIERGLLSDVVAFDRSKLVLFNLFIEEKSRFANQDIAHCRSSIGPEFVIVAINRDNKGLIPSGSSIVHPGDTLAVAANSDDKAAIYKVFGQKKTKAKKIVIVGGSKIARFLLRSFDQSHHKDIKLIDRDKEVCERFASLFPKLLVINSDVTDETLFEDERLASSDLLISLTDNDELNTIIAIFGKQVGILHTMALINNNNNYIRLARSMDIDSVISVSEATVDSLLKYMRGSHVASVHSLFNGRFEIFEFMISKEMSVVGKHLSELPLNNRGVIAGITRKDGKNIIPTGSCIIEVEDTLLVCAAREDLDEVQHIFA